jgi:Cpl-7 lysozyme C-terminal domain./NlpC/P60 family.
MKKNTELVAWAISKIGLPYCYGTFGQIWDADLLKAKSKQYPDYYGASRQAEYKRRFGKQVFDCVGLIKGFLWWDGKKVIYNAAQDVSADGMLSKCKEKGAIGSIPELPGVLVFLPGHVGVYIGNGEVIEAKGFADGVVKTKLAGRGWKSWGKCPWIEYTAAPSTDKPTAAKNTVAEIAQEVINGKWGNGTDRTKKLTAAGYDPKAVQAKVNELLKTPAKPAEIKVGSIVQFKGGYHYKSASAVLATGLKKKAGQGKVTAISKGAKHPYHIIPNGAKPTDAYGWVSADTVG